MPGLPRLTKKTLALLKIESTVGVDAAPSETASGNAIKIIDPPVVDATQEWIETTGGDNTLGFRAPIGTVRPIGITFRSYVTGHGAGSYTAALKPPLGDVFRACGYQETFISSNAAGRPAYRYAPAAAVESHLSASIVGHIDGYDQRMVGCRGNFNMIFAAAGPAIAEFTFRGQLTTEAETVRGTATHIDVVPPRWIDSGSILVNSYLIDCENLNIQSNNTLLEQRASSAGSGSGILQVLITERAPGGSFDPYTMRTSSHDVISLWRSSSGSVLRTNVGLSQGNRFSVVASNMVYKQAGMTDKSLLQIYGIDYQLYQHGAGNNEMEVEFS
jgi:hypothetical protein